MHRKVTVIPAKVNVSSSSKLDPSIVRVASYCRVSTELEDQQGSFRNQVEYYTNLIASTPGWISAGIFADEGISGTGTKKRSGFMDMIKACEDGRVDLVITKSISRFARNTADSLFYCRRLKALVIPIIFEKEAIKTTEASGELMFTILSSLAQEESRNISENTAWGIRSKFQQGIPHLNTNSILGFDKDEEGNLIINEEQAVVVRRVYRDFMEGWHPAEIARHLNAEGVPGVHGKAKWHPSTIIHMLQNEKHVGDLLMQKTYTPDFLTKVQAENKGNLEQYYIQDNHPGIVSRETWDAVQLEFKRREEFCQRHQNKSLASSIDDPFYSRVFCGKCGGRFLRHDWKGNKEAFWRCEAARSSSSAKSNSTQSDKSCCAQSNKSSHSSPAPSAKDRPKCSAERISESELQHAVVTAWNEIVASRDTLLPAWREAVENGNALTRYYAQMMIDITADGPLERHCPELTRLMVDEVIVGKESLTVRFKDGTEKTTITR